jgi:site-specific DNA recombinase
MALRFAPIIRVSTEGQEKKGESLRTQTTQIKQYVKSLNGTIPNHCWQYSGQEHATPNQERKKLDRLLADSVKDLFDAVIVCDASRWSRDNQKSKSGLEILRNNGIRFFGGTMEYDLFNPEHSFFLGISAEIGELQARQQTLKSITNRIERARRGLPTSGKLPYGRTYSEVAGWGIDPEKQKHIQQAAGRYLKGESIVAIASTFGMNFANLWKILNHRSGDKWEIRFKAKNLNIDETVELTIPRLLDEQTISAIHEKARANKTYTHGEIKNQYLLSRMIFCAKCGYTLFGQTNHGTNRYYRHPRHRKNECPLKKWIPANLIENSVLIHLVQTFGDVERLRKAVDRATPDLEKLDRLSEERETLSAELKKITGQKNNVVDMVADGLLSKAEVQIRMEKLRARESHIQTRLADIELQLENRPDPDKVKRLSKFGMKVVANATMNRPELIFKKPYQWKRNLIEHAFAGQDTKKQRLGVYIEETDDPSQPWKFEIRGILEKTLLGLPFDDTYIEEAFNLDHEFQDVQEELTKIRSNISSFTSSLPDKYSYGIYFAVRGNCEPARY